MTATISARYPSLAGRHCLVTGGASGIGAAIVAAFVRQGCVVSFLDIDEDAAAATAAAAQEAGDGQVNFEITDLTDLTAALSAVRALEGRNGRVDILINNAGDDRRMPVADVTPEFWDWQFAVNLRPHFFLAQHVAEQLDDPRGGAIVNLSSIVWQKGVPKVAAYAAAKAGVMGLTKTLARAYGPKGVRVNAIAPGWVMTPKQRSRETPQTIQDAIARQAIPEALEPDDVANACLWLAADDSRHVTGQTLVVDGGTI